MRNYECMLIISASVSEEKRGELISKFSKMASSKTSVEKWGLKKFSYPIQKRNEGFYVLMHFQADSTKVAEMTRLMNITDGIVRFMFVEKNEKQVAADEARRAAKRAAKAAQAQATVPAEPVAG